MKTGTLREDESRRLSNQDFPSPESTVREIAGLVPKIKTIVFDQEVIIGSGVSRAIADFGDFELIGFAKTEDVRIFGSVR